MYVLGINSMYHESAACLLRDGALVAMAEEERFNRVKHGKKPRINNADELPVRSIRYCLEEAGISIKDVAFAGYSCDPAWADRAALPAQDWMCTREFVE